MGRDADSAPTGFEENQGTARLGNRLDRIEVAIQNLTQCMANLVESKQAAEAPGPMAQGCDPSRGQVNDCQSRILGGFPHSLGVQTCVGLRCSFSWKVPGTFLY